MKPAALAGCSRWWPRRRAPTRGASQARCELPPETAQLLAEMLAPTPPSPQARLRLRHPSRLPPLELARLMAEPEDTGDLERQVAVASPSLSASRALATAVAVSRKHADAETVCAIGDSLPQRRARRRVPHGA